MATETEETETSTLGDEWQWINNDTAEVLRATVENAFIADPRKTWTVKPRLGVGDCDLNSHAHYCFVGAKGYGWGSMGLCLPDLSS